MVRGSAEERGMIGAIAGDIMGSVYEHRRIKTKDFSLFHQRCHFTDDSVLIVATTKAILENRPCGQVTREVGRNYPRAGHGGLFSDWLFCSDPRSYGSWLTAQPCA